MLGKWACNRLTEDADFGKKKIIFSDEAHFVLVGYVNKQNCRIWGKENSHAYIEKFQVLFHNFIFKNVCEVIDSKNKCYLNKDTQSTAKVLVLQYIFDKKKSPHA